MANTRWPLRALASLRYTVYVKSLTSLATTRSVTLANKAWLSRILASPCVGALILVVRLSLSVVTRLRIRILVVGLTHLIGCLVDTLVLTLAGSLVERLS